jgi:hypothetical protein
VEVRENGRQLVTGYHHQLVVRRRVQNPLEKDNIAGIVNYIDLGIEMKHEKAVEPEVRMATSWQINKNCLVKGRVSQKEISVATAFKTWWDPSGTIALSAHHSFNPSSTRFGLSVSLDNLGHVLFGKPSTTYRRTVASQKQDVTYLVEQDPNY